MKKEFDPMRSYIESESRRRQAANRKFSKRTKIRIKKWARLHLFQIASTFSNPMIAAIFMLNLAGLVAAFLLSKEEFANPVIGMPVTLGIFGLCYTGYTMGAKSSKERTPVRS